MIERTLVLVKPDGVARGLIGEIISRFEKNGLRIAGLKVVEVPEPLAKKHYTDLDAQIVGMGQKTLNAAGIEKAQEIFNSTDPKEIGGQLREWMLDFIMSAPAIAIALEGDGAVQKVRKIVGFTDPSKAEKGTIRGDLGVDAIIKANTERRATHNLVHASGSIEEAEHEIKLWFGPGELIIYKEK